MLIGSCCGTCEPDGGVLGKELDHPWRVFQKHGDPFLVEMLPGQVAQIGSCCLGVVHDALRGSKLVTWRSHPTARDRRRSSERRRLFHDQDIESMVSCDDRRRHAGGTGANHQNVALGA